MEWTNKNGIHTLEIDNLYFEVWQAVYTLEMDWRGAVGIKRLDTIVKVEGCESLEQARAELIAAFAALVNKWQGIATELEKTHSD